MVFGVSAALLISWRVESAFPGRGSSLLLGEGTCASWLVLRLDWPAAQELCLHLSRETSGLHNQEPDRTSLRVHIFPFLLLKEYFLPFVVLLSYFCEFVI